MPSACDAAVPVVHRATLSGPALLVTIPEVESGRCLSGTIDVCGPNKRVQAERMDACPCITDPTLRTPHDNTECRHPAHI